MGERFFFELEHFILLDTRIWRGFEILRNFDGGKELFIID